MARKIRVASVSMAYEFRKVRKREDNLNYIAETVAEIASIKPDLICLPEAFPIAGLDKAEKVSEKDTELLCNLAKKYCTYLVGSIYEIRGGEIYNTALVVNRKGEIVGRYDKIHPTEGAVGELGKGILPGKKEQLPVKTDFGKVGIQICFDANWPQEWQGLVEKGADLIVFSSAFPAGTILNSIAVLSKVYIVPAIWSLHSGIIDNTGRWVVQTDRFSFWVWAAIDLERTVFHWDYQEDRVKEMRRKYGDKLKIETFGPEAWFVLEPTVPEVSIPDIVREFKLITYRDYIKRATEAQDRKR
ncbi:MAG: carbon-nitrogen hydrolase family protein [Candidatus Omnitrophota bacterium]